MLKPVPVVAALLTMVVVSSLSSSAQAPAQQYIVLDGDTVVADGLPLRVAGIGAPELGPWARCWAEAALAGHARLNLQRLLTDTNGRGWQVRDVSAADARGRRTARLVDREGYDITDDMVVHGYAARTSGRWDWCGRDANLYQVLQDEPPLMVPASGGPREACSTVEPPTDVQAIAANGRFPPIADVKSVERRA